MIVVLLLTFSIILIIWWIQFRISHSEIFKNLDGLEEIGKFPLIGGASIMIGKSKDG